MPYKCQKCDKRSSYGFSGDNIKLVCGEQKNVNVEKLEQIMVIKRIKFQFHVLNVKKMI